MGKAVAKPNLTKCPYCPEEPHSWKLGLAGNHVGNGGTLGGNIMEKKYKPGKSAMNHPLSVPEVFGEYDIAQAHHLICSETMKKDKDWANICASFGYDINHKHNGIFLPADMRVACQLNIPLHRGNHDVTETGEGMTYVDGVKNMVQPVKDLALQGDFCKAEHEIIPMLNEISGDIWELVKEFTWTLTYDGKHYQAGGIGCLGELRLPDKRANKTTTSCNRKHDITIIGNYFLEQ